MDREKKSIDQAKLTEALTELVGAGPGTDEDKKVIELKAGEDVPYVWPAQVIDVVKQNQWTIVLIYRNN